MSILSWDKPKRVQSVETWKEQSFEDGPDGGYVSNMSREDFNKWKAKLTGTKSGNVQVEIRKSGMVIVVGLDGYKYKHYERQKESGKKYGGTDGLNLHIACAGPIQLTFEEFDEMKQAVQEAKERLIRWNKGE